MVGFRGSTQENRHFYFSRFGYRKVVNDKMVPDPVGSGSTFGGRYGNDERDSPPQTQTERHQPHHLVVHRVVRLHRDGGEGRAPAEEHCRGKT
jgi:hypothetical protein